VILPAISVRQPWAWAILFARKDTENRTWPLPADYMNRPILLHAPQAVEMIYISMLRMWGLKVPTLYGLQKGGIIAKISFCDCKFGSHNSRWSAADQYNWIIDATAVKPLEFFEYAGRMRFFDVDYPFNI
jgi:hypothetical protein